MFGNKIIDKYSNYYYYVIGNSLGTRMYEVEEDRLLSLIQSFRDILKKPYLRFMWMTKKNEAVFVLYDGDERLTGLVTMSEAETLIRENKIKPNSKTKTK